MKFRFTQNIETDKSILWHGQLPFMISTKFEKATYSNIYDLQKKSKKFKWTEEAKKHLEILKNYW